MGIFNTRPAQREPDRPNDASEGRNSGYGERYVLPAGNWRSVVAEEGSYFTANNATTATELTGHAAPAIADEGTKPLLYVYNGGDKNIHIDQVVLRVEVVNASATDVYFSVLTTNELSRDSGGTQITPVNARSDNPYTSKATVYFGAVVTTPSATKFHSRSLIRQSIGVTEDRYYFQFGGDMVSTPAYVATVSDIFRTHPPLVIAPGGEMLFCEVNPSGAATAATYEFMLGYVER